MKVTNYEAVPQKPVEMDGADKCHVRMLVGEADGAPNFAMRQFEVEVGELCWKAITNIRLLRATWYWSSRTRFTSSATLVIPH